MIFLLGVLTTWYLTKVYYTRELSIHLYELSDHGLAQANCVRCSQHVIVAEDDLRNPFYCLACR